MASAWGQLGDQNWGRERTHLRIVAGSRIGLEGIRLRGAQDRRIRGWKRDGLPPEPKGDLGGPLFETAAWA